MDFYLDDSNCIERLLEEWRRYGSIIVAYDFDNTVFDYYGRGYTFNKVIDLLRECRAMKFHLIVFTSCGEERFPEIRKYLDEHSIPYDSINETPDFIPYTGRKVYYNILLDDRAGLSAAYNQLSRLIYTIRGIKANQNLVEVG